MHGHMPVLFDTDAGELPGHMAQDDLLSPSCRGKGLGQVLLDGVRSQAPDFAAAMWFNDVNHRSYSKAGWTDVPGFRRYVRFLDAGRLAQEISNPWASRLARVAGPLALPLLDLPARLRRRRSLSLGPITRFDARFDALWERSKRSLGIAMRRNAAYLNWRFVARPFEAYRRVEAVDGSGALAGYTVCRSIDDEGSLVVRVLDVLADPGCSGALETLLLDAVAWARTQGATHVVCAAAQGALVSTLRRAGFLPNPRDEYHMVMHWEGRFPREVVTDVRRWYLTLCDADGDVWTDAEG
jgi:GNAT superfamily N-acetyltransferase